MQLEWPWRCETDLVVVLNYDERMEQAVKILGNVRPIKSNIANVVNQTFRTYF
jgi:hypothetical protein